MHKYELTYRLDEDPLQPRHQIIEALHMHHAVNVFFKEAFVNEYRIVYLQIVRRDDL